MDAALAALCAVNSDVVRLPGQPFGIPESTVPLMCGLPMPETVPAIFFGHGNPMNALMDNEYTAGRPHRESKPEAESDSVDFSALVCAWNRGYDQHSAKNDP